MQGSSEGFICCCKWKISLQLRWKTRSISMGFFYFYDFVEVQLKFLFVILSYRPPPKKEGKDFCGTSEKKRYKKNEC